MSRKLPVYPSSGNVFADLGIPNPEEYFVKAGLAAEVFKVVKARRLTQAATGRKLGIPLRKVSAILRGQLDEFSIERLIQFLNALGCDVQITVSAPHPRKAGKVQVKAG
jgi:predicted XRE-type DNA-binding protein